jgi:hypothetical protein
VSGPAGASGGGERTDPGVAAVLGALGDDAVRGALVARGVDFLLSRPVNTLLDAGEVVDVLAAAVTEDNVRRVTERWLEPCWERHKERSRGEGDTVGDAVPEADRERIRALLREARLPRAKWADGAVDPQLMRDLFAPVLQQTLLGFVKRLPGMGGAAGAAGSTGGALGGLAGAFGKRALEQAGRLADVGRGVLGGAIDERVQQIAREFSRGAVGGMRDATRERLKSDEGKRLVGQIREQVFERLLTAKVSELMDDAEAVPLERLRDVAASLVAANAERDFVRTAVREEVQAWLALEGARTVGDLLTEAGIQDTVRTVLIQRLDGLLAAFAAATLSP